MPKAPRRLSKQLDEHTSTIAGMPGKVCHEGTGTLGAVLHGAPGAGSSSNIFFMAYEVMDAMARECDLSREQCRRALYAFGKVAHDFVTSGKVVGIPHMGYLVAHRRKTILKTAQLGAAMEHKNPRLAKRLNAMEGQLVSQHVVMFRTTHAMFRYFNDYAIPVDSLPGYIRAHKPHIKELMRSQNPEYARKRRWAEKKQELKESSNAQS